MKDKSEIGIYRKFEVRRTDGRDAPGEKHHGCKYFVIDVDHDKFARKAIEAYARACINDYPELSNDLFRWIGSLDGSNDNPFDDLQN